MNKSKTSLEPRPNSGAEVSCLENLVVNNYLFETIYLENLLAVNKLNKQKKKNHYCYYNQSFFIFWVCFCYFTSLFFISIRSPLSRFYSALVSKLFHRVFMLFLNIVRQYVPGRHILLHHLFYFVIISL